MKEKVLVVDDDREMCSLLQEILTSEEFSVTAIQDSLEAAKRIAREDFDLLITDLKMKGLKGLDLMEESKKIAPLMPVIIITAFGTVESAIQAMKRGAYDYITKPFQTDELLLTVKKALENRFLKKEVTRLKREVESRYHFHQLIGKSPAMQRIYDLVEKISDGSGEHFGGYRLWNQNIVSQSGEKVQLANLCKRDDRRCIHHPYFSHARLPRQSLLGRTERVLRHNDRGHL